MLAGELNAGTAVNRGRESGRAGESFPAPHGLKSWPCGDDAVEVNGYGCGLRRIKRDGARRQLELSEAD